MLEHPDITAIRNTGYPAGYVEPEPYRCPVCGAMVNEYIYRDRDDEIVGCDRCIIAQEYWEIGE